MKAPYNSSKSRVRGLQVTMQIDDAINPISGKRIWKG